MEDQLRPLWAEVLDRDTASVNDNAHFFDIGGDSVAAMKLAGAANRANITLHAQTIFEKPIFSEMAQAAKPKQEAESLTGTGKNDSCRTRSKDLMAAWDVINACLTQCNIPNHMLDEILPCTPFQREFAKAVHNLGVWIFQYVFEVGNESLPRAKETFETIRWLNKPFRTRIVQCEHEYLQVVTKDRIEWQDVHQNLESFKDMDKKRRMCYGEPLGRFTVVQDSDRTYIVWTKAHATFDRLSKQHLIDDIRDCFQDPIAFSRRPARPSFGAFVRHVESIDRRESVCYWKSQLEGLRDYATLIPTTSSRQHYLTTPTAQERIVVDFQPPKDPEAGFDAVMQTAWTLTLANECGLDDIFFCQFRSCRQLAVEGVYDIIGPLFSMVPVRRRLRAEQTIRDMITEVHRTATAGVPHEPFGPDALQEFFGHEKYLQSVLLPQTPHPGTFSSPAIARDDSGKELKLSPVESLWGQARVQYALYIMLTPNGHGKLDIWARFDESVIKQERVRRLLRGLATNIEKISEGDWSRTSLKDLCPDLQQSSAAEPESTSNGQTSGAQTNGTEQRPGTLNHLIGTGSKDRTAVVIPGDGGFELSHASLHKHIATLQEKLATIGIKKGSAVSIALPNSLELIAVFLAATWQRGIAAPLNPGYKQEEFNFYISDLGSALLVVPRGTFEQDGPAIKAARKYKAAVAEIYWSGEGLQLEVKDHGELAKNGKQDILEAAEDDVALVLHTSGTTGKPKAVPLTNLSLMTSITNICRTYQLTSKDRTMLIMPLFHVHGLLASFLSPLYSGGSAIIPPRLEPSFWEVFERHGATWFSATPSMHRLILQFPRPETMPQIRFIRSCSSQLSPTLLSQLEEAFGAPVLESYAMTEASHLMTSNPLPPDPHIPGSVGKAQGVEVRILDEQGNAVDQDGIGEVCIRGDNVMKGYLNNPDANKSSFTAKGYFRTGDQGKLDAQGYLTLTGRLKEMINKGGEKISPVELDNIISQHESVAEVVCFAIDDEAYGQDVGCAVRLVEGAEVTERGLKEWVGEQLSNFKVPKQVWFMSEIPKTATGKVQRKLVAETVHKSQ